ncbi:peptide/nickel transport system substrate-binding protein [Tepidamorphus gemmatus]|uniref:Peptide/nickel transport system substrate-binding protein n=1 Tax=Tepidamorphus gemmatus TaxID=747076 RepID=A0A4R3M1I0_9HYPH|nr:ABC transporter substrate-binding protein [Tepidamorphus gemmatus]TCT06516.1 peptide/nickel transport system substrate-binding protein [Tepidamorphus gemmatus]
MKRARMALAAVAMSAIMSPFALWAEDRTLTVVAPWEIKGFDPSVTGYAFTRMEVAETLIEIGDDGLPIPALAASWIVSEDGRTWRFDLRPNVTYHDGSRMTAADVVHSLEIARGKPGVLDKVPIESIEAVGDAAVLIRLSSPFSPLLAFLAHTSAQILAPASYAADGSVTQIVATGPYRIVSVEPPQRFTMERFDGYWGEKPEIARTMFLAAGRGETRTLLAESGDAQIVFNLDPASLQRLAGNDRLEVRAVPLPRVITMKVNAAYPPLADAQVPRALSLAMDRQGIASALLRQPDVAASQLFPPGMAAWHNPDLAPLTHDPERARKILAGLGWMPGADGILEKDGVRLAFTIRTYPDRPELPLVATALEDQFREIGVDATIAVGNSGDIPAGHQDGTLEAALIARNFSLVPDPLGTLMQDFGAEGGDWGAMNWKSDALIAAIDTVLTTGDAELAEEQRRVIARILQDELPVIPVVWYVQTAAVSKDVENFSIDPFERSYRLSRMRWAR